jgi:hypothetical protein
MMSRPRLILGLIALVGLGGLCLYLNRDWFSTQPIQIMHRVSPWLTVRGRRPANPGAGNPVVFSFDKHYRFTSVKVFVAADAATNKYPHAIWSLTSDSNSVPTATFTYGGWIRGMRPIVRNASPDPLEPGVKYRLVVEMNGGQAQHDFSTTARR